MEQKSRSIYYRPRSDCSGTAVFPFCKHFRGKLDSGQISERKICLIYFFSMAVAAEKASVGTLKRISKQLAIAKKVYSAVNWAVNLSEKVNLSVPVQNCF